MMPAYVQVPMPGFTPGGRYHGGHGMDQWQGDCGRALRRTALRLPGRRFADLNFQGRRRPRPGRTRVWNLHSRTARENGYRFLQVGLLRREPMTDVQLDQDLDDWDDIEIARWCRTPRRGRSYESRVHPGTFGQRVRQARRLRVRMCAEIKWPISPAQAIQMVAYTVARRVTVFFMGLVYQTSQPVHHGALMVAAGHKAKAIDEAGGQFALLTHGFPHPADLDEWRPYITQFWGTNAKEYRT